MKLTLIREVFTELSTIGSLYVGDKFFCYTLEDKDRGLKSSDLLPLIIAKKIYGKTAIPKGTYKLSLTQSPRFGRVLPRLHGVKGFDGVLLHRGNSANDSLGCILLGYKKGENSIFESTKAETNLINYLTIHGNEHEIEIK
jgi:hypothetical protein